MSSRAALLLAGLLTFTAPALAQESAEDPVVAEVDGQKIHMSDIEAAYQELPEQYRQLPVSALAKPLVERVIDDILLQEEAERQGLAADPLVQREIERARGRVLRAALLQKLVDEASTEERLRATYEAMKSDPAFAKTEFCASHILVDSEDEAKAIIAELKGGADFTELAKARSKGPTGPKGGDLGCFRRHHGAGVRSGVDGAFAWQLHRGAGAEPLWLARRAAAREDLEGANLSGSRAAGARTSGS
jgi:peptidyl-prolyl cis-trans isomerase C